MGFVGGLVAVDPSKPQGFRPQLPTIQVLVDGLVAVERRDSLATQIPTSSLAFG